MKKKILLFCIVILSLIGCEDQEFAHWYVVSVWHPGMLGNVYHTRATNTKADIGHIGVRINCEPTQSGCQDEADYWGLLYDDVVVLRQKLDTFYQAYFNGGMDNYLATHNLETMFPRVAEERPGAIDSVEAGTYKVYVAADSSIVFLKAPLDSIGPTNIVFAVKRDAYPND